MIKNLSLLYKEYILRHPIYVLFVLAIILMASLSNIKNFTLDASADTLILEDDQDLKIFRETNAKYKSSDFMILTLTDNQKNIFSTDTLDLVETLSKKIENIKNIKSVNSITNIPLVTSSKKPLTELINNIPNILSEDVDRDLAKTEILSSPIYKDLIISSDGKTTAMQIIIRRRCIINQCTERKKRFV